MIRQGSFKILKAQDLILCPYMELVLLIDNLFDEGEK